MDVSAKKFAVLRRPQLVQSGLLGGLLPQFSMCSLISIVIPPY